MNLMTIILQGPIKNWQYSFLRFKFLTSRWDTYSLVKLSKQILYKTEKIIKVNIET